MASVFYWHNAFKGIYVKSPETAYFADISFPLKHFGKKKSTFGKNLLHLGENFSWAARSCRISFYERNDMRFNIYILRTAVLLLFLIQLQGCAFSQADDQTVYITRTGNKYHKSSCQYLKHSRIGIRLSVAKEQGYTACSACHSAGGKNPAAPVAPKQQHQQQQIQQVRDSGGKTITVSRQCIAKTKSGNRCKRTTQHASGKCWQHQ